MAPGIWSPLTADQSQQLLRASLPVGGRAITLYEEIHPRVKLGNRRVQQYLLARLHQLLPEVECLGWQWLGRIRNRDFIAFADRAGAWLAAKCLYAKATHKPKLLGSAPWVRRNPLTGQLVTFFRLPKGRKYLTVQKQPAKSRHSRNRPAARKSRGGWLCHVLEGLLSDSGR